MPSSGGASPFDGWGLVRGGGSGGRGFGEPLGEPPAAAVSGGSSGQQLTRTREIPLKLKSG